MEGSGLATSCISGVPETEFGDEAGAAARSDGEGKEAAGDATCGATMAPSVAELSCAAAGASLTDGDGVVVLNRSQRDARRD